MIVGFARCNEDDGCQIVEEAVSELCTFHPFVQDQAHVGADSPRNPISYTTKQGTNGFLRGMDS